MRFVDNPLDYIAGDDIRVFTRWGSHPGKVVRVTPTGRVVVRVGSHDETFDKRGRKMGSSTWSGENIYSKADTAERYAEALKYEAERKEKLDFKTRLAEVSNLSLRGGDRDKIISELRALIAIAERGDP